MKTNKLIHFFMVLLLGSTLYGCAAVVAGGAGVAATYNYFEGKLTVTRNANVDRAYSASIKACKSLGLTIEKKSKNLTEASISGKDGDRSFWIWISAENAVRSAISVRVGLMGDQMASERIQNTIHQYI